MKTSQKQTVWSARSLALVMAASASLVTVSAADPARAEEPRKERERERSEEPRRENPPAERRKEGGEERAREGVRRDAEPRKAGEARREGGERREGEARKESREGVRREGESRKEGDVRREGDLRKEGDVRREAQPRKEGDVRREGEPRKEGDVRREGLPRQEGRGEAQRPPPEPRREGEPRGDGRGAPQRPGPFGPDLNDEQRRVVQEAMMGSRAEMQELMEKNRQVRHALEEAMLADPPSPEMVEQRARAIGEIEARLAVVRARSLAKIRPHLMAQQFEQLRHSPMFGGMGPMAPGGPPAFRGEAREGEGRPGDGRGPRPEARDEVRRPAAEGDRRGGGPRDVPPGEGGRRGEGLRDGGEVPRREAAPRDGAVGERPRGEREPAPRRDEAPPRREGDREPERRPSPR